MKSFYHRTYRRISEAFLAAIAGAWLTFAHAAGGLIEEAAFRAVLAFNVLAGRVPVETHKRPWVRSVETPVLIDVFDWTSDRLIFSVLVWPSLESSAHEASSYAQHHRAQEVKEAIARGAADKAWCTRFETDYGLVWDHARECWVDGDGYRYDGSRFGAGSRRPDA